MDAEDGADLWAGLAGGSWREGKQRGVVHTGSGTTLLKFKHWFSY